MTIDRAISAIEFNFDPPAWADPEAVAEAVECYARDAVAGAITIGEAVAALEKKYPLERGD